MLTIIAAMAGCSSPPSGEDVLVLRVGDYVGIPDDPQVHPLPSEEVPADTLPQDSLEIDSLPLPDSTLLSADSLAVPPDSAETAEDSLPQVDLPGGMNLLAVEIRGSLYGSLEEARDVSPDVLGAHCVRYLWWDINPWTGLIAGDSLRILYSTEPGPRENCISAMEYIPVAGSSNRRFSVYVYRRSGDNFPSIWYSDGSEVVRLLDRMPLSTFEEVTGIFGERRGSGEHRGVDFKAPTGVPVRTVFGGTVNRVDWNPEYNGRCVEVRTPGGSYEVFLHLDQIGGGVSPGRTLEQGSQVGTVGNSGRSYASHLHYQINDSEGNPVDPYACLGSRRRSLEGDDMVRFAAVRDSLDILLRGL